LEDDSDPDREVEATGLVVAEKGENNNNNLPGNHAEPTVGELLHVDIPKGGVKIEATIKAEKGGKIVSIIGFFAEIIVFITEVEVENEEETKDVKCEDNGEEIFGEFLREFLEFEADGGDSYSGGYPERETVITIFGLKTIDVFGAGEIGRE